jgi:hypothetical protein
MEIGDWKDRKAPDSAEWGESVLVNGYPSLALFFGHLARASPAARERKRWTELSHVCLYRAVEATQREPLESPALYTGAAGLACVLADSHREEPRLGPMLDSLHERLAGQAMRVARPRAADALAMSDYDVVAGAAGVLGYLVEIPEPSATVRTAIHDLLNYLVWLASFDKRGDLPHRLVLRPSHYPPYAFYRQWYPHGYVNLGLAHGAPGVLAAMAVAWRAGYRMPGQHAAMASLADWLVAQGPGDERGQDWATGVPLDPDGHPLRRPPERSAWCYGTAGVASSLLSAGAALDDGRLRSIARQAFEASVSRQSRPASLSSSLCHGLAGLLAISSEFARAGSVPARRQVSALAELILARCDPDSPFGVWDDERHARPLDDPGFLTGVAGVGLALLAASAPTRPAWFRVLLIA